uniref:Uncharacterized protein n=1 Tax=uncultured prokaryote TaxID=198431 RepID=A0A0H5QMT4_9ZZZZ|nr:hypothetical protein [uncultured prokaryote]
MAEYYTIKDMASEFKCTYEAVRQQTSRYSKELAGHSHLDGKTRYYDDWAVEFLRERRKKNPIIIEQTDTKQLIEELQQKNTVLLEKVAVQADKLAAQSEELRNYDKLMLESGNKLKLAESRADEAEQRAAENEKNATKQQEAMVAQQNEIAELKAQLEAEQNRKLSFAERFRGRKKHRD